VLLIETLLYSCWS